MLDSILWILIGIALAVTTYLLFRLKRKRAKEKYERARQEQANGLARRVYHRDFNELSEEAQRSIMAYIQHPSQTRGGGGNSGYSLNNDPFEKPNSSHSM
ncbi:YtxH domain-containing protein [Dehalogenimonas etheniformans]|uniref:YtxH domain-containing protein n=1 Tax=Dehalogenimonas etheniformans TaxID=1536648 RepID=A0A2P5P7W8_9CHLR|nr:YtxH domain-containing protein [Dehalogenimonas etheniformans]PPD58391.1 YtxH domain-containing protein [Dehalogenimonas etheniformans]QNT76965.1 YtxH domain-containing protein [Dehalogenimonas etheniformans]